MKNMMLAIGLLLLSSSMWADTILLKDGKVVRGYVSEENESSVLVEQDTEWRRILRSDIERIKHDDVGNISKGERTTSKHEGKSFKLGAQAGIYNFSDGNLSKAFGQTYSYGAKLTIWGDVIGAQLEVESISAKYTKANYYGLVEELNLLPVWISLMARGNTAIYPFFGVGIGLIQVNEKMSWDEYGYNYNNYYRYRSSYSYSEQLNGVQALVGIQSDRFGITLKYTTVNTKQNIGLGGLSILLSFQFI